MSLLPSRPQNSPFVCLCRIAPSHFLIPNFSPHFFSSLSAPFPISLPPSSSSIILFCIFSPFLNLFPLSATSTATSVQLHRRCSLRHKPPGGKERRAERTRGETERRRDGEEDNRKGAPSRTRVRVAAVIYTRGSTNRPRIATASSAARATINSPLLLRRFLFPLGVPIVCAYPLTQPSPPRFSIFLPSPSVDRDSELPPVFPSSFGLSSRFICRALSCTFRFIGSPRSFLSRSNSAKRMENAKGERKKGQREGCKSAALI